MEGWYVAKAKPRKELGLMSFLERREIEVFFPRVLEPGRQGPILKPLFPTYMFCRFDAESGIWPVVRWAHGISYFLSQDGVPVCVPQSMIEYLQERVADWNGYGVPRKINQGDKVVVLGGPFAGLEGVFERYVPGRQRCTVLLEVIGRMSAVELPEVDIKKQTPVGAPYATRMLVGANG